MCPFFLPQGALHLLVVDLYKFSHGKSDRGNLFYSWLDVLLYRYWLPGCSVLVVGTHIDLIAGDDEVKDAVHELHDLIDKYLKTKHDEMDRVFSKHQQELDVGKMGKIQPPVALHFFGVMAVSCWSGGDKMDA
ncbi:unnamed protein product [Choristocarpus tenellus]